MCSSSKRKIVDDWEAGGRRSWFVLLLVLRWRCWWRSWWTCAWDVIKDSVRIGFATTQERGCEEDKEEENTSEEDISMP